MTKDELRRKAFIKAAREVIKIWPGYGSYRLPAPTNRTDCCIQCDLRHSLDRLVATWIDVRSGKVNEDDFNNALARWRVDRLYAAEVYGIGQPEGDDAMCKKQKYAVKLSREKKS